MDYQIVDACRSCGWPHLTTVLDLGATPLANALLHERDLSREEETYPLRVALCENCSLVQLTITVSPEKLFGEYAYFSSVSQTVVDNARDIARRLTAARKLNSQRLVVEVASNDGYLLKHYQEMGVEVLGIDPAKNVADAAKKAGVPTVCDFFGYHLAMMLSSTVGQAAVIHANNVLAHVADQHDVVAGFRAMLADDGILSVEVPYVVDLVEKCEFDTIYHEHLCYFSLTAIKRLFFGEGLAIIDVERIPIHGGSLRVFAVKSSSLDQDVGMRVTQLLNEEASLGVASPEFYESLEKHIETIESDLVSFLQHARDNKERVWAYGASAKGATLLNVFGITDANIECVVDASPAKQGLYMPGSHLPIVPPSRLSEEMPDYALLLAWNHAEEIVRRESEYLQKGGMMVVPVPEVKIL